MNLEKVTKIDQIKKDDTIIITGAGLVNHPAKAYIVKVSKDGTEIIFDKGKSWCKELAILK